MPDAQSRAPDSSAVYWDSCIQAARRGDRSAQGEIFERLRSYLRARAQEQLDGKLQIKVSPSDVVQETLMAAYQRFDTFHGQSRAEVVLWMQGILHHRVQRAHRRYYGTDSRNLALEVPFFLIDGSRTNRQQIFADEESPSGQAMASEEQARLEAAIRQLPPRSEQVIRLRNELKLSFAEVGVALECTSSAAQRLWSRAIHQLARRLKSDAPVEQPFKRPE